jgi:hypothetical protein
MGIDDKEKPIVIVFAAWIECGKAVRNFSLFITTKDGSDLLMTVTKVEGSLTQICEVNHSITVTAAHGELTHTLVPFRGGM